MFSKADYLKELATTKHKFRIYTGAMQCNQW